MDNKVIPAYLPFQVGKNYVNEAGQILRCLALDKPSHNGQVIVFMAVKTGALVVTDTLGVNRIDVNMTIVREAPEIVSVDHYAVLYFDPYDIKTYPVIYDTQALAVAGRDSIRARGYTTTDIMPIHIEGELKKCRT